MKIIDIVLKDLRHFFSSVFSLMLMFVVPLFIPMILFLAFGKTNAGGFDLPVVQVALVNMDQTDSQSGWSASEELARYLKSEDVADLISVIDAGSEVDARRSIEQGESDVAVIIPPNFSSAAMNPGEKAQITIASEPTIRISPQIVSALINGFNDGLSGAKIAVQVATHQMEDRGLELSEKAAMSIAEAYIEWVQAAAHADTEASAETPIVYESPVAAPSDFNPTAGMIPAMMGSMIIFFVFFTGANGASMIIQEEEDGTLRRLFTTPTRLGAVLGGKSIAVLITLALQVSVLSTAAVLIFGIRMGALTTLILSMLSLIVSAAGLGLLLMSFIRTTRQTGIVMGGLLTIMAMVGGLFSSFVPDMPDFLNTIALATPQGWAMKSLRLAMTGAQPAEVLMPVCVSLGLGAVFFLAGLIIFRKRFA